MPNRDGDPIGCLSIRQVLDGELSRNLRALSGSDEFICHYKDLQGVSFRTRVASVLQYVRCDKVTENKSSLLCMLCVVKKFVVVVVEE